MKIIPSSQLANRLPVVMAYTFRIGNRLTSSDNFGTSTYAANCLNQYTAVNRTIDQSVQSSNFTYDADGNLTQDDRFNYAYDDENRLVSVTPRNPSVGSLAIENAYDHRNRRIRKVVKSYDGSSWNVTETSLFVWDGWNIVLEKIAFADNTTRTIEYYWGNDLSGTEQGAGGVGGLLATRVDGVFYIPCYGCNGNIMMYVGENGSIAAQYDYDPYGNILQATGPLASQFAFGFSTKYHDREVDLIAYQLRTYDSDHGRWLNRDPIGEAGGLNLYVFVLNDPIGSFDALGNRRTSLPGIVMDGWCEDAYRYAMSKMQTSEERRAWDRYTNHGWRRRDRDIGLSPDEVKFVAESINAVVSYVENQRKVCKGGFDFSVSKSIGGAAPSPWVKALGGVSVKVATTCSGGCFSYEYQINDLSGFMIG